MHGRHVSAKYHVAWTHYATAWHVFFKCHMAWNSCAHLDTCYVAWNSLLQLDMFSPRVTWHGIDVLQFNTSPATCPHEVRCGSMLSHMLCLHQATCSVLEHATLSFFHQLLDFGFFDIFWPAINPEYFFMLFRMCWIFLLNLKLNSNLDI